MTSNSSLFFQIATGLIPLLLVGGWLGGVRAPAPDAADHLIARVLLTALVVGLVLAEFFAIAEAVSADFAPSTFRTIFVAEAIAIETVLLGVGFLVPWFSGHSRAVETMLIRIAVAAGLGGVVLGGYLLSDAVHTAALRRDAAAGHCVRSFTADYNEAYFTAWDQLDRLGQRRRALDEKRERLERLKTTLPTARFAAERKTLKEEQSTIDILGSAARAYFSAVSRLGGGGRPRDFEEILAGITGC